MRTEAATQKPSQTKQADNKALAQKSIFKQLGESIKTYSGKLKADADVFQSHFDEYSETVHAKVQHLEAMWDYDVDYRIGQKFSQLWKSVNAGELSYLDSNDRLNLNSKFRELRDSLEQIETDQSNQRRFIAFLSKVFRRAKQRFQRHEHKDVGVQASLEGVDPADFASYEKAEDEYKLKLEVLRKDVERDVRVRKELYEKEVENYLKRVKLRVQVISNVPIMRSDAVYDQSTKCNSKK